MHGFLPLKTHDHNGEFFQLQLQTRHMKSHKLLPHMKWKWCSFPSVQTIVLSVRYRQPIFGRYYICKVPLISAYLNIQDYLPIQIYWAVIKFHFGPLVDSLETNSMYFFCKILNSMVFGLMDKLLQSGKVLETGLNTYARPNTRELKILHRAGI